MPRLFFAVRTPASLIPELEGVQQEIAYELNALPRPPKLRAENLKNSHCTLRFLGDVQHENVDAIIECIEDQFAGNTFGSFDLSLTRCGVFPNRGTARVLWAGLDPIDALRDLQELIDRGLSSAGISFENENAFHPHLTLFRFKDAFALPKDFELPILEQSNGTGAATEVVLVESQLTKSGAMHEILAAYPLDGQA